MNVKQGKGLIASCRTLLRLYNEYVTQAVSEYTLSPNEVAVLSGLQTVSTASAIAKDADVSKALVSRSVKSLKEKGLIKVDISAIDKREQDLSLTQDGLRVAQTIEEANARFIADMTRGNEDKGLEITCLTLALFIKNLSWGGRDEGNG